MRGAYTAATSTNYATGSLYNNSTGAEMLALWYVYVHGDATFMACVTINGTLGSKVGAVAPVVGGELTRAGQLYYVDNATAQTPDIFIGDDNGTAGIFASRVPVAVIQPGQSFVTASRTTGTTLYFAYLWQIVHPEDLDGKHCAVCDGPRPTDIIAGA